MITSDGREVERPAVSMNISVISKRKERDGVYTGK